MMTMWLRLPLAERSLAFLLGFVPQVRWARVGRELLCVGMTTRRAQADREKQHAHEIELAKLKAKTARYMARMDKLPWVTCPTAVAIAVIGVAGQRTNIDLTFTAAASLSIVAPLGLIKIWYDRQQKRRLRKVNKQLESENRQLRESCAELRGRVAELRRDGSTSMAIEAGEGA